MGSPAWLSAVIYLAAADTAAQLDACRKLTPEQYVAEPVPGWLSVRSTIYHIAFATEFNLRALADDPDDFLRYCRWSDASIGASSFVSRQLYGTYLEALLAAAEQGCGLNEIQNQVHCVHSVISIVDHIVGIVIRSNSRVIRTIG